MSDLQSETAEKSDKWSGAFPRDMFYNKGFTPFIAEAEEPIDLFDWLALAWLYQIV
jgi:hypothetical protein